MRFELLILVKQKDYALMWDWEASNVLEVVMPLLVTSGFAKVMLLR